MSDMRKTDWTPNTISASKMTDLRQCPRMYYFKYEMGIERAREEGARRFGTMMHAGLEAWWRARGAVAEDVPPWEQPEGAASHAADFALVAASRAIAENARHVETDPYEAAKAQAVAICYHERYLGDTAFRPIAVEQFFRVPVLDAEGREVYRDWSIAGKKDALVEWAPSWRVTVVEHKHTSSDIDAAADYWRRLTLDSQLSMYVDAARQLGYDCRDVVYDVVRPPKLEPLKATAEERRMTKGTKCKMCEGAGTRKIDGSACAKCEGTGWKEAPRLRADAREADESTDEYSARVMDAIAEDPDRHMRRAELTRTEDQLIINRRNVIAAIDDIERYRDRRYFPQNTNACQSIFGRRCDYLEICSGEASPDDRIYTIRKKKERKP